MATDMKPMRRLATAAEYAYDGDASSVNVLRLSESKDGGQFGLHPLVSRDEASGKTRLLLPHATQPTYAAVLELDDETAGRLGRALLGIQRKGRGEPEEDEALA